MSRVTKPVVLIWYQSVDWDAGWCCRINYLLVAQVWGLIPRSSSIYIPDRSGRRVLLFLAEEQRPEGLLKIERNKKHTFWVV